MASAQGQDMRPLVNVSPEDLVFELVPNKQPGCPLFVSNESLVTIAFKVKTTEPNRYLVRPNQGLVGPGDTMPVNVCMVEKDYNEFLRAPAGLGSVMDKFLVQTAALGDSDAAAIRALTTSKQSERLASMWSTFSKAEIRNKKLGVRIGLLRTPADSSTMANTGAAGGLSPARSMKSNASSIASPVGPASSPVPLPTGRYSTAPGSRDMGRGAGGGGGGIDVDSRALANKYEDLVNYTASLTEERDELNQSLEDAKKALQREMATRIALESKGQLAPGRKGTGRGAGGARANNMHQKTGSGFSIWTLVVVAAVFFMLGHWLDFASPNIKEPLVENARPEAIAERLIGDCSAESGAEREGCDAAVSPSEGDSLPPDT